MGGGLVVVSPDLAQVSQPPIIHDNLRWAVGGPSQLAALSGVWQEFGNEHRRLGDFAESSHDYDCGIHNRLYEILSTALRGN